MGKLFFYYLGKLSFFFWRKDGDQVHYVSKFEILVHNQDYSSVNQNNTKIDRVLIFKKSCKDLVYIELNFYF